MFRCVINNFRLFLFINMITLGSISSLASDISLPDEKVIVVAVKLFDSCEKESIISIYNQELNKSKSIDCHNCQCAVKLMRGLDYTNASEVLNIKACLKEYEGNGSCNANYNYPVSYVLNNSNVDINISPECKPDYIIQLDAVPYIDETLKEKSDFKNIMALKEDEVLLIEKIYVLNDNDCNFGGWTVEIKILDSTGLELLPATAREVDIPILGKNQAYILDFNKRDFRVFGPSQHLYYTNYRTTIKGLNETLTNFSGIIPLSSVGVYEINGYLKRHGDTITWIPYFEENNYTVRLMFDHKDGEISKNIIKVMPKLDIAVAKLTDSVILFTKLLLLIAYLQLLISFVSEFW